MSFVRWLRKQVDRDDEVGWIAEDVLACIESGCFVSDRGDPLEMQAHLRQHYEQQLFALEMAIKEYEQN